MTINFITDDLDDEPLPLLAPAPTEAKEPKASKFKPVTIAPTTAVVSQSLKDVTRDDPALRFCTPEFWALIEEGGSEHDLPDFTDEDSVSAFNDSIKFYRPTVTLTDMAKAMGIPAPYARAYLRSIHSRLRALGVELRERRLKEDEDVSEVTFKFLGEFVSKDEKADLKHAHGEARRAMFAARDRAKAEKSPSANKAVNDAQTRLTEIERATAEMEARTSHLPVPRHAFSIIIDPAIYQADKDSAA